MVRRCLRGNIDHGAGRAAVLENGGRRRLVARALVNQHALGPIGGADPRLDRAPERREVLAAVASGRVEATGGR